jgi:hypothetical protein
MRSLIIPFLISLMAASQLEAALPSGVREIKATSCEVIRLNVALGMTSQIMFEETPTLTLHADEEHFKIRANPNAKRSIAIIPFVEATSISQLFPNPHGGEPLIPSGRAFAEKLDQAFKTNLFVFFKHSNQLMFELHFVEKTQADYILNVKQVFRKDCQL